jgi:hypothetical protein
MRKYLPTLSELIDRLSIAQLKEVFIAEHKSEYSKEIQDILYDIQLMLDENPKINAEIVRAIVVLSQMNLHIWHNESNYRKGIKDGNNLELTHGLNGIRNTAKNKIQEIAGGRKDYKIDCLAADFKDWEISWNTIKIPEYVSIKRKNSKDRYIWSPEAVKNNIVSTSKSFKCPSLYMRKKYPSYIIEINDKN